MLAPMPQEPQFADRTCEPQQVARFPISASSARRHAACTRPKTKRPTLHHASLALPLLARKDLTSATYSDTSKGLLAFNPAVNSISAPNIAGTDISARNI